MIQGGYPGRRYAVSTGGGASLGHIHFRRTFRLHHRRLEVPRLLHPRSSRSPPSRGSSPHAGRRDPPRDHVHHRRLLVLFLIFDYILALRAALNDIDLSAERLHLRPGEPVRELPILRLLHRQDPRTGRRCRQTSTWTCPRNRVTAIIGFSRRGRASILGSMISLLKPDLGQVLLDPGGPGAPRRKKLFESPKKGRYFSSVRRAVRLPRMCSRSLRIPSGRRRNWTSAQVGERVHVILREVGVEDAGESSPTSSAAAWSGGSRSRRPW